MRTVNPSYSAQLYVDAVLAPTVRQVLTERLYPEENAVLANKHLDELFHHLQTQEVLESITSKGEEPSAAIVDEFEGDPPPLTNDPGLWEAWLCPTDSDENEQAEPTSSHWYLPPPGNNPLLQEPNSDDNYQDLKELEAGVQKAPTLIPDPDTESPVFSPSLSANSHVGDPDSQDGASTSSPEVPYTSGHPSAQTTGGNTLEAIASSLDERADLGTHQLDPGSECCLFPAICPRHSPQTEVPLTPLHQADFHHPAATQRRNHYSRGSTTRARLIRILRIRGRYAAPPL